MNKKTTTLLCLTDVTGQPKYFCPNERPHEKTNVLHMRKQRPQISFAVTAKLISAFVFATWIVQSLYFLIRNFKPLAISSS